MRHMDEVFILLQAKLDEAKSKKNLNGSNGDIARLQKKLDKLKLQTTLDPDAAKNLANEIGQFINQKIVISDIEIHQSDTIKEAKKTGEQIGNAMNQGIESATNQATKAEAKKSGNTFFGSIKEELSKMTQKLNVASVMGNVIRAGKQMVTHVTAIDTAMLELSKVSDLSGKGLEQVSEQSFELGERLSKTGTNVLATVTTFKRAGYDIADSMKYAEEALKTTNISNNLKDTGQAADSLINIMKGFQNETPQFASKINDAITQVSNTGAVDFDHLIDGAIRLSSVADQAGLSFEQMLGTLTGGYEVLRNMEEVATGQIAIFSRLQGISLDGETEGASVSKLQETFHNATNGAVNIVDQTTGQLKNVYSILDDIANVWDSLDNSTRQTLAIEVSGSSQKDVFLAMMQNWNGVKSAVESATNSFGSADAKNEKHLNSIQGKMENFKSSVQQISGSIINSGLVKWFVDLGTNGVNALNSLVNAITPLGTIGLGAGLFASFKNVGGDQRYSPICFEIADNNMCSLGYRSFRIIECEIHMVNT